MNTTEPELDRDAIIRALRRLAERLAFRGIVADPYVFGGAAMALAYDTRRSTRNVDALVEPHGVVFAEAANVALELGLPAWWLNEQASAYVSRAHDPDAPLVFDHPGLRVHAASPRHLLAVKVMTSRRRDARDVALLAGQLGLATTDQVLAACAEVFPDETPPERARLLLDDTLRPAAG